MICISSVSAADLNNDTADVDADVLNTMDELTSDDNKRNVDLTSTENYGIYGNGNTILDVFVKDDEGNNVTEGSLTFVDVFGKNYAVDVKDGLAESSVFVRGTEFSI